MRRRSMFTNVLGCLALIGWLVAIGAIAMNARLEQSYAPDPNVAEVKCDAVDIYVHPHDTLSVTDADEIAEIISTSVLCRRDALHDGLRR